MSKSAKIQAQKVVGSKLAGADFTFQDKDSILYALGISFNLDPLREQDFKYTNEFHPDFTTFPTISSLAGGSSTFQILFANPHIPEFAVHQILHGQEKLHLIKQKLTIGATYKTQYQIIDVLDKGKNAFFVIRITGSIANSNNVLEPAFYIDRTIFVRGLGGFGYKGSGKHTVLPSEPTRQPDAVLTQRTFPNQAFFYRLNGDSNPLHIDPNMSSLAGFQKPIIHGNYLIYVGLASYGIVAKSIVQNLLNNDATKLRSYQAKFIGHVFPGESLSIKIWKEATGVTFLAEVVERKTKAISGFATFAQLPKL